MVGRVAMFIYRAFILCQSFNFPAFHRNYSNPCKVSLPFCSSNYIFSGIISCTGLGGTVQDQMTSLRWSNKIPLICVSTNQRRRGAEKAALARVCHFKVVGSFKEQTSYVSLLNYLIAACEVSHSFVDSTFAQPRQIYISFEQITRYLFNLYWIFSEFRRNIGYYSIY